MLSISEPYNAFTLAHTRPNYNILSFMSRQSPRKKRDLQPPTIKKTQSFQQLPPQQTQKINPSPARIAKKISINTENFVSHKTGSFDQDYTVQQKIGEGSFGAVYRVVHKALGIERALKIIKKKSSEHFSTFQQIDVLKKLDHTNILKIYEFYEAADSYYLITQIFDGRQLFDEIVDLDKLDQELASNIISQVLRALHYIHSNGIAHRDIKPENIMVKKLGEKGMKIKIIDWGLGTLIGSETAKRICGTPEYCAPEVFKGNYSVQCDMWSVGVIVYMMQTGQMLYRGKNTQQTISIVQKGLFKPKAKLFNKLSSDSQHFMKSLLVKDPLNRLTAEKALQHPWIKKYNDKQERQVPEHLKETLQRLRQFKVTNMLGMAVTSFVNNHLSSNEEREVLDQTFRYLDKNGDGVLSSDELLEGYIEIYGKQLGAKIANDTFTKLDLDGKGNLQYSDFIAFGLKRQAEKEKEKLAEAFSLFDKNKDGKITWKQIGQILNGRIQDLPEQDFMGIIKEVDQNGDGEVDFSQFIKCVESIEMKVTLRRSRDLKKSKDKSIDLMRLSK